MMKSEGSDEASDVLVRRLVAQISSPLTNEGVRTVQGSLDQLCEITRTQASLRGSFRAAGGIPILSTLLNCGEEQLAYSSASLVRVLADDNHENKDACRDAGVISALLTNVQCGKKYGPATPATAALGVLVIENNNNRDALVRLGAIPILVKLLSAGPYQDITMHAANTLRELCIDSQSCREEVAQLGAVKTLTGLLDPGLDQGTGAAAVGALLSLALTESLRLSLHDAGRQSWKLIDKYKSVEDGSGEGGARPGARLQAMLLIALLFGEAKVGNRAAGKLLNRLDVCAHVVKALQAAHGAPDHTYLGVRWTVQECVTYLRWLTDNEDFTDRLSRIGAPGVLAEVVRTGSGGPSPLLDACVSMVHLGAREAMATTVREAKAAEDALRAAGEMFYRNAGGGGFMCPCDCSAQQAQDENVADYKEQQQREQRDRDQRAERSSGERAAAPANGGGMGGRVGSAGVSSFDRPPPPQQARTPSKQVSNSEVQTD